MSRIEGNRRRVDLRWLAAATVTVAVTMMIAGCAGGPRALTAPDVQLVGLTLAESTAESQRFRVNLRLTNPNEVEIPIERISFNLRVAGGGVMSGRTVEPLTVAPGEAGFVQVDVTTNLVSSVSRLFALLQGPASAIPYDLDGLVTVSRGLNPTFPFNRRGEVPLSLPAGAR